jgi:hypothetical protein
MRFVIDPNCSFAAPGTHRAARPQTNGRKALPRWSPDLPIFLAPRPLALA